MAKKKKKKKLGSIKDVPTKDERPILEKIWDYKEYLLVGLVIVLLAILYTFIIRNLDKNPEANPHSPVPVASLTNRADMGNLKVNTTPTDVLIQFRGKTRRAPTTFKNVPEGEFMVILSLPGYKTVQKTVRIEPGKTKTLNVIMEK